VNGEKTEAKVLLRSDRVDETRVGDRVVLYHRDTGSGVVLNPTGSRIWDSLVTPASADDIIERLSREHRSIPRERIAGDVEGYIASLKEQKLIDEQR
jgi:Coenzyme PQQ synthesis protein D (PqqD).